MVQPAREQQEHPAAKKNSICRTALILQGSWPEVDTKTPALEVLPIGDSDLSVPVVCRSLKRTSQPPAGLEMVAPLSTPFQVK